jgi:hypothetical protein
VAQKKKSEKNPCRQWTGAGKIASKLRSSVGQRRLVPLQAAFAEWA